MRNAVVKGEVRATGGTAKAARSDPDGAVGGEKAARSDADGAVGGEKAARSDAGGAVGGGKAARYDAGGAVGGEKAARYDASGAAGGERRFRKSLRNARINYRNGWFFVTVQVAKNKSIFGAIVGEKVVLNELGRAVEAYWRSLAEKYPELELFEFVVMPNHFHALLRIHYRETNREHHLGFLMGRFKGGTAYLYGKLKREGRVEDIGEYLWQLDYWDKLVTSDAQFAAYEKYIRENPKNWSRDRWGAVTSYCFGNLELLNCPRIAFVASQGYFASELRPKRVWQSGTAKAARYDAGGAAGGEKAARYDADGAVGGVASGAVSERAASAVLISTFTSAQEREALRRALAQKRPLIAVFPGGLPAPGELAPDLAAACREGCALLVSPQPEGSRLNKKVATWCNEYVLRHSGEIWVGDIKPNGMLAAMLNELKGVGL